MFRTRDCGPEEHRSPLLDAAGRGNRERGEQSEHLIVRVDDGVGAVDEALDAGGTQSRAALLRRALLAGGTLTLGGVVIAGLPRLGRAAPSPAQDARILNLVLLLEYLGAAFYGEAVRRGTLTGERMRFAEVVGAHERAHAAFIARALGGSARKKPTFDFGDATGVAAKFTAAAVAYEDLSVAAYNGQATNLTKPALAAAARIVSVEARHAAWIRDLAGQVPAPSAIDRPATAKQVTAAVRKTRYLKSS